jgi:hypothetical protein
MTFLFVFFFLIIPFLVQSGFIYDDFIQTTGLVINGDARIWACDSTKDSFEKDQDSIDALLLPSISVEKEGNMLIQKVLSVSRNDTIDTYTNKLGASFGHRETHIAVETNCVRRLRLTQALQSQVGSAFYERMVPVFQGFDTVFEFLISGQSRLCKTYFEEVYSKMHHRSCSVHGGDGFAFIIHGNDNGSRSLGSDGKEIGYGGIVNSLAIEFDMWPNVGSEGSDDMFYDHISIHSASLNANSANATTKLGTSKFVEMGDGKIHRVRIQYLPFVEKKYLESMTANENLIPYIKDNGEGRRLGTLAVFVDDLLTPLISIPLNLSVLLDLPHTMAYIGFTASTGYRFQNHDILKWEWCDSFNCSEDTENTTV